MHFGDFYKIVEINLCFQAMLFKIISLHIIIFNSMSAMSHITQEVFSIMKNMKLNTSAPSIVETHKEPRTCLLSGVRVLSTAIEIEEIHSNLYTCTVYMGGPSWRVSMPSQKNQSSGTDLYQLPILTKLFEYEFEMHYKDGRCFGVLPNTGKEIANNRLLFSLGIVFGYARKASLPC